MFFSFEFIVDDFVGLIECLCASRMLIEQRY